MTGAAGGYNTATNSLVHTLPPSSKGRRSKKSCLQEVSQEQKNLEKFPGLRRSCWHCGHCSQNQRDVRTGAHAAPVWYLSPHGHPALAGTLLHPPTHPPCLGIGAGTAKSLPKERTCSCPFRGAASCTAGWQSSARIPSPTSPGKFLCPSQGRGLGGLSHTLTPY